jgi:N-acetylglucosamine kinase-like BadF-type ATPase
MNILIESGATKSTCIGYEDTCIFFMYKTTGINATYATKGEIRTIIEEIIVKNNIVVKKVETLRYYGAGCFSAENAEKVQKVLNALFPDANIAVFSDLYAACHALCKKNSGFVGILGTGAASCFYDGEKITNKAPSLGYLLGDEGSGAYIGKQFIAKYLKDTIDAEIVQDFEKSFEVTKSKVLKKVYQTPNPQTFFASIPVFLQKHIQNEQIITLIANSFQDFFAQQKAYYSSFPCSWFFCGSIAYYFQDILMEVARKNNIRIEKIIRECAEELLHF